MLTGAVIETRRLEQLAVLRVQEHGQLLEREQATCQRGVCQGGGQYERNHCHADGKSEPKDRPLRTLLCAAAGLVTALAPLADDGEV